MSQLRGEKFNLQPAGCPWLRGQTSHLAPPQSDMPSAPSQTVSPPFAQLLSFFFFSPSNVSEVKAVCSSRSICTYTSHVKESGAKSSERKHSLDKSGRINVHNRKALPRRSRSVQITVFPITAESIWLILLTKLGSRICYRRKDSHPHQDLAHLQAGPLLIPPFQFSNLGVASSSFHYYFIISLLFHYFTASSKFMSLDTEKNTNSEIKISLHFWSSKCL